MMIENIQEHLRLHLLKHLHFRFNGARNQIEEFDGYITYLYPRIFTIKLDNGITRSFSYSDVMTKNLEIIDI